MAVQAERAWISGRHPFAPVARPARVVCVREDDDPVPIQQKDDVVGEPLQDDPAGAGHRRPAADWDPVIEAGLEPLGGKRRSRPSGRGQGPLVPARTRRLQLPLLRQRRNGPGPCGASRLREAPIEARADLIPPGQLRGPVSHFNRAPPDLAVPCLVRRGFRPSVEAGSQLGGKPRPISLGKSHQRLAQPERGICHLLILPTSWAGTEEGGRRPLGRPRARSSRSAFGRLAAVRRPGACSAPRRRTDSHCRRSASEGLSASRDGSGIWTGRSRRSIGPTDGGGRGDRPGRAVRCDRAGVRRPLAPEGTFGALT